MSEVSGRIRGLEQVGGKAGTLAEGQTYAHDSDFYKTSLAAYAGITPGGGADGDAAMASPPGADDHSVAGRARGLRRIQAGRRRQDRRGRRTPGRSRATGRSRRSGSCRRSSSRRSPTPASPNGIPLDYVQRNAVPVTQVALAFDAGTAADSPAERGLAVDDHGPARRRHVEADQPGSRRGRGAARRRRQHEQCRRPLLRLARHAVAQPVAVARPADRR